MLSGQELAFAAKMRPHVVNLAEQSLHRDRQRVEAWTRSGLTCKACKEYAMKIGVNRIRSRATVEAAAADSGNASKRTRTPVAGLVDVTEQVITAPSILALSNGGSCAVRRTILRVLARPPSASCALPARAARTASFTRSLQGLSRAPAAPAVQIAGAPGHRPPHRPQRSRAAPASNAPGAKRGRERL